MLNTHEVDTGVFLRNHLSWENWADLDAGVRYDWYQREQENLVKNDESSANGDAWSPSVGLSLHLLHNAPKLLTAYASWGEGFNPVYRNVGPLAQIMNVDPETSQSYEVGLKTSLMDGRIEGNVAVYRQERNDVVSTVGTGNSQVSTNIGDWGIDGIETGLKLHPIPELTLFGSYTYRNPEIEEDFTAPANNGNQIAFVAKQLFTVGLEYAHPSGLFTGVNDNYVGPSFADNANTIHLPAYHLMNIHAGYRWRKMEVALFCRNLLDEEYYSAVFNNVKNGSAFEGTPRSVGVSFPPPFKRA